MRLILALLAICLLAGNAGAQDALFTLPEADPMAQLLEEDAANEVKHLDLYLKNCMAQKHPTLNEETLIPLCLCTAANMEERFNAGQISTMFEDTKKAQELRDEALERAFAPCMHDAMYEIALTQCKRGQDICTCFAQGLRYTMSQKEIWLAGRYIATGKDAAPDPLAWYMQHRAWPREDMQYNLSRCIAWHR
ncbi:MAG TPA: hypothetical protein PLO23_02355 [Alphaproteobacteria bacterium]|nr:hypothetical protein [Alphaproteobacteria bacterium]